MADDTSNDGSEKLRDASLISRASGVALSTQKKTMKPMSTIRRILMGTIFA
jgi:hypothetical protein